MKTFTVTFIISTCLFLDNLIAAALPSSQVVGWGVNTGGQATGLPSPARLATNDVVLDGQLLSDCIAIAAGRWQGLALRRDGTIAGWGLNYSGEATGSPSPGSASGIVTIRGQVVSNVVSVSAGTIHNLALLRDGTVVSWGGGTNAEFDAPKGLNKIIAVSAGDGESLALEKDGTVVSWPNNLPLALTNISAVAATHVAWGDNVVLKRDGTVIKWNRGMGSVRTPSGLSNVVAVAAGGLGGEDLALRSDGTVVDLPYNKPDWSVHAGLSDVVAIAAGGSQCVALKRDGTVVAWGGRFPYRTTVPEGLTNVVAIAAGEDFCLAITTNTALAEK